MVIDDLHIVRTCVLPTKAQSELVVDPDGVLAGTIFFGASSE
jgi:hypothetical protein